MLAPPQLRPVRHTRHDVNLRASVLAPRRVFCIPPQGAVPAGAELCGGDDMARSVSASVDALIGGDASAAVFKRDIGELMVRPL